MSFAEDLTNYIEIEGWEEQLIALNVRDRALRLHASYASENGEHLVAALRDAAATIRAFRGYYVGDHRLGGREHENTEVRHADEMLDRIYRLVGRG
jgi:hypothetical protein